MRDRSLAGAASGAAVRGNSPVSTNDLKIREKGSLSEAALFAILNLDSKLRTVKPR